MSVFVIDHNPESTNYISQIISSLGLTPKPIRSLASLVTTLQLETPRLIIAEALLPGYDDFIVLQYINDLQQKTMKNIPVIVTTSRSRKEDILKARQLGAKGFLIKPFDKKSLIQQIKLALKIKDLTPAKVSTKKGHTGSTRRQQQKISLSSINTERLKSRILQKIEAIPSLPAIVYKVMKLINDENSNAADFENLIVKDQALTARMLRMVNSSFFSLSRKVNSISDAVVYLGHNTIKSLVLGASTSNLFKKSLKVYGYRKEGLWQHANLVAALSRYLAKSANLTPAEIENCYVSGLLHDIGKLILGPFVEQFADRFAPAITANEPLSQIEKTILGFDHGEIGGILLTNWKLPKNLIESVTLHHFPENATVNPRETLVISLANNLSNRLGFALEQPVERLSREQREKSYKMLNLPADWEEQHHEEIAALAAQILEMIDNL